MCFSFCVIDQQLLMFLVWCKTERLVLKLPIPAWWPHRRRVALRAPPPTKKPNFDLNLLNMFHGWCVQVFPVTNRHQTSIKKCPETAAFELIQLYFCWLMFSDFYFPVFVAEQAAGLLPGSPVKPQTPELKLKRISCVCSASWDTEFCSKPVAFHDATSCFLSPPGKCSPSDIMEDFPVI